MDWFKKQKFANWIIALLVLINIVTLVSLWSVKSAEPLLSPPRDARTDRQIMNFLREEIGLDESQAVRFRNIRSGHFERFGTLSRRIEDLRRQMMDEVLADPPDTLAISRLTEEIGRLQALREKYNAEHFMHLREICGPAQRQRFNMLMHNLLPRGPGRGGRNARESNLYNRTERGLQDMEQGYRSLSRQGRGARHLRQGLEENRSQADSAAKK